MTVELGGITLNLLTQVFVEEQARIVHHEVPGMSGNLAQTLGRPSVRVVFQGIFFGEEISNDLQSLRDHYLARQPVDLFTEAIGEGYFTQVLISRMEVNQRADYPNQFDFMCEVVEYIEPPEPITADPLAGLDTSLLDEATTAMDDLQNALDQVSQLTDLIANVPSFGNPTEKLNQLLDDYREVVDGGLVTTLKGIRDLF